MANSGVWRHCGVLVSVALFFLLDLLALRCAACAIMSTEAAADELPTPYVEAPNLTKQSSLADVPNSCRIQQAR